jgi:hypothetical protein
VSLWLHFERPELLNFDFDLDADPDLAFDFDADPDLAFDFDADPTPAFYSGGGSGSNFPK